MEFFELIKKRYSVRAYQSKPIEDEKLQKVLEAVRIAPTASNRQPFRFIVIPIFNFTIINLTFIYHENINVKNRLFDYALNHVMGMSKYPN